MLSRQCTPIARSIVKKKNDTWQPQWVALPILDFVREIHKFKGNDEALCIWVKKFSEDLLFCNTDTEDELTKNLLMDSFKNFDKQSKAGRKAGLASANARKQRQQQQNLDSGKPSTTSTNDNGGGAESSNVSEGDTTGKSQDTALTTASSDEFGSTDATHSNAGDEQQGSASAQAADGAASESATSVEHDITDWHEAVCQALGTTDGYDQEAEALVSQTGAGAAPLQNESCHNAPAPRFPRKSKPPKNAEEVRYFAADHDLDVEDARDWYEMNYVDRPGCNKDGVAIENWKGHCTAYCQTMAERRKAG